MRGRSCLPWLLLIVAWLWGGASAFAQFGGGREIQNVPVSTPAPAAPPRDSLQDADTFVSFIDSALPRTQARFLIDDIGRVRRPTRAGYLFPNLPLPETNVNYVDITSYGELVIVPSISVFLGTPLLFLDPDQNRNYWGLGDMNVGFKWGFLNTQDLLATFQVKATLPTADNRALGTGQVSVEPGLLFNYHLTDYLTVEGEGRYWAPIGGNRYNGDFIRYGLGLAYGQRDPQGVWFAPVVEGVGWTMLGGREQVPGAFSTVVSSRGETILNLNGGLRLGLGNSISIYGGYSRAITGSYWYKDLWRLEIRFFF